MSGTAGTMRAAVPPGYEMERERGAVVVALPSALKPVRAAVAAAGSLHAWAAGQPARRAFTGRGTAWGVSGSDGDWVVRHYRRGGAVARLLGDAYVRHGEPRPFRELRASTAARSRGVASPEVVAVVVYPAGILYRADIATRLVPDSMDLAETTMGDARLDEPGRIAAWRAAGTLLRAAFEAGVHHADLNLRNILIAGNGSGNGNGNGNGSGNGNGNGNGVAALTALLLDLDRATVTGAPASDRERDRMLDRLHRSRRKI
ncbi:MAG TPA: lipopolysaccharide kinase InaA family protein, partial [Longimicrobiales bacterium]|nr:lipopolysaccharide kinase InaA family protein [Longimicrobiales bacterium]